MNKLILFLLCISLSSILCSDNQTNYTEKAEEIFYYALEILKGMSDSGFTKCSDFISDKKDIFFPIIEIFVEELDKGEQFENILEKVMIKNGIYIISLPGFAERCRLLNAIPIISIFTLEGIQRIGENVQNNAEDIVDQVQMLKNTKDLSEMLLTIGKIVADILNYYVQ